jgi:hypothetical protein
MIRRIWVSLFQQANAFFIGNREGLSHSANWPALAALTGNTKRGRAQPQVPNLFKPNALCAARIAELCRISGSNFF